MKQFIRPSVPVCCESRPVLVENEIPGGFSEMSVAFRALGDEVRLAIIEMLLREDEVCACRFLDCCSVSQPTLSYHLKELREAGLIKGRKDGLWVYYRLERGRFDEIVRYLTRYLAPSGA